MTSTTRPVVVVNMPGSGGMGVGTVVMGGMVGTTWATDFMEMKVAAGLGCGGRCGFSRTSST